MKNNFKTVMFGAMIAAMILPFSAMPSATAQVTETRNIEEITVEADILFNELMSNETTQERADQIQARFVELGYELERYVSENGDDTSVKKSIGKGSKFKITGHDIGCDLNLDSFIATGYVYKNAMSFWTTYTFPQTLSNGSWPNCEESAWNSNLHMEVVDIADSSRGCVANWITTQHASHRAECQELGQGFWRFSMSAEYEGKSISGHTLVVLL